MGIFLQAHPVSSLLTLLFLLFCIPAVSAQLEKVDTTDFTPMQLETLQVLRNSQESRPRGWRLSRDRIRPIGTPRGADIHLKRMVLLPTFAAPSLNGSSRETRSGGSSSSSYQFSLIVGVGAHVRWERVGYDGYSVEVKKPIGVEPQMLFYQRSRKDARVFERVYALSFTFLGYASIGYGYSTNNTLNDKNRHMLLAGVTVPLEDFFHYR
ncbi:hypothetical protein KK062_27225 [Fulvivirgaceae bacterium PWU5]|uniref:Uncharacterized protein n=1 Tax=Dawidia cretensis TaxID=2782350 RepID=A0AAP2E2N5_9BACT|nr:hypothetical protein [Dawidia cretensis]MBT1711965.1 hypothetical protein [Dawidia cretensis]